MANPLNYRVPSLQQQSELTTHSFGAETSDHAELSNFVGFTQVCPLGTHFEGGELVCRNPECFVCRRTAAQSVNHDVNAWKRTTEEAEKLYSQVGIDFQPVVLQAYHTFPRSPQLTEKKSYYFYDKRFGRKRRYDPWFSEHAAQLQQLRSEEVPSSPPTKAPKKATGKKKSKIDEPPKQPNKGDKSVAPEKQNYDFSLLDSEEVEKIQRGFDLNELSSNIVPQSLEDADQKPAEECPTAAHEKSGFLKPPAGPSANLDSNSLHLNLFFHMYPTNDYVL